jgi:hypothetical protein
MKEAIVPSKVPVGALLFGLLQSCAVDKLAASSTFAKP